MEILDVVKALVLKGHTISMSSDNGQVFFDMNTGAKSHLHIYADAQNNKVVWKARYDNSGEINLDNDVENIIEEIASIVKYQCMCGRDYVNSSWVERFIEYDLNS